MFEFFYIISVGIISFVLELLLRTYGVPMPLVAFTMVCMAMLMQYNIVFIASFIFGLSFDLIMGNSLPFAFPLFIIASYPLTLIFSKNKISENPLLLMPTGFLVPFLMAVPHFFTLFHDADVFPALLAVSLISTIILPILLLIHCFLFHFLKIGIYSQKNVEGVDV